MRAMNALSLEGGTVTCGGIHMGDILALPHGDLRNGAPPLLHGQSHPQEWEWR